MSRRYRHEYSFDTTPAEAESAFYALLDAVEASMPPSCYGVGFGHRDTGKVRYIFLSNRTKGRRIVARIDELMGVTGSVSVDLPAVWNARQDAAPREGLTITSDELLAELGLSHD